MKVKLILTDEPPTQGEYGPAAHDIKTEHETIFEMDFHYANESARKMFDVLLFLARKAWKFYDDSTWVPTLTQLKD